MDFSYFSLITHFQQSIVLFSALAIIDMLQSLSLHIVTSHETKLKCSGSLEDGLNHALNEIN